MKKLIVAAVLAVCSTVAAHAAKYEVALVVQNHTSGTPVLPMSQIADTLAKSLSASGVFSVVVPDNSIGVNQNRSAAGEEMPMKSAIEIGRTLGAVGVVTASIHELTSEDISYEGKVISHRLQTRIALNLYDAATGGTACEGAVVATNSDNKTSAEMKTNAVLYYEKLLHTAAEECSRKLLANVSASDWKPSELKKINVFFGCNVLGATLKIDGAVRGTCPMEYAVAPGVHRLQIAYPPYYFDGINEMAEFDQEGQTFKVVLQLNKEGEAQRNRALEYDAKLLELEKSKYELEKLKTFDAVEYERKKLALEREKASIEAEKEQRCELFMKQMKLADAMLNRYKRSGAADDYVRKTIADGTSVYWKNSFGRIAITDGKTDNIEFATPVTDGGDLVVPPSPQEISEGLKKILKNGGR